MYNCPWATFKKEAHEEYINKRFKNIRKSIDTSVILLLLECLTGLAGEICGIFYMTEEQSVVLGLSLLLGSVVGVGVSVVLTKIVFMMYDNQIAAFYEIHAISTNSIE